MELYLGSSSSPGLCPLRRKISPSASCGRDDGFGDMAFVLGRQAAINNQAPTRKRHFERQGEIFLDKGFIFDNKHKPIERIRDFLTLAPAAALRVTFVAFAFYLEDLSLRMLRSR
ncbi:hypothetical protein NC796_03760 [Aliifodinibius sp. S!AR15-10]|uniref:hypothetical protein n=1 Tax=Aliifodinibius sp. S!AR15-10 TaxID=2950437 RepID=UPI00285C2959|nr:hypothetical protein [Aliifodinibius sp. S!AR15-10]MDR8390242.1 hypothetical protein [Aliifodinibius sp. S!AR15-10]